MLHLPISFQIPLLNLKLPNCLHAMLVHGEIGAVPSRLPKFLSLALVALGLCYEVSSCPVRRKTQYRVDLHPSKKNVSKKEAEPKEPAEKTI